MSVIETNLTDSQLADFLENKLFPAINSKRNKPLDGSYWINSLRNNSVVGSHQWKNLAQIIIGASLTSGLNSGLYLAYCAERGNY